MKNATVTTNFRAYGANLTFLQVPRVRVQLPTHAAAADTPDASRLTPGSLLALPTGVRGRQLLRAFQALRRRP